jgi:hypothetical protein
MKMDEGEMGWFRGRVSWTDGPDTFTRADFRSRVYCHNSARPRAGGQYSKIAWDGSANYELKFMFV